MATSMFLNKVVGLTTAQGDEQLEISIQAHISTLLNTRKGSVPHQPEYGLPDVQSIYFHQGNARDALAEEIKKTVRQFEPRLRMVEVKPSKQAGSDRRVTYIISGQVGKGSRASRLTFETEILRDGRYKTTLARQYG